MIPFLLSAIGNLLLLSCRVEIERSAIDDSGVRSVGSLQPWLNAYKPVEVIERQPDGRGIRFAKMDRTPIASGSEKITRGIGAIEPLAVSLLLLVQHQPSKNETTRILHPGGVTVKFNFVRSLEALYVVENRWCTNYKVLCYMKLRSR